MAMSLCVISTRAPYQGQSAREALDAAFVSASCDITTSMLLAGDGVYQLLADQTPAVLPRKSLLALMKSLPLYGIETIHVDGQSLTERHIPEASLMPPFKLIPPEQLADFLSQHDKVLSF